MPDWLHDWRWLVGLAGAGVILLALILLAALGALQRYRALLAILLVAVMIAFGLSAVPELAGWVRDLASGLKLR